MRQFPALEVVNLEGNPVCDEVDYKTVCLAYLPKLNYLDWALVNPAEVQHSMEAVQDDLMELKENEGINAANKEKEDARAEQLKQLAVSAITAGTWDHTVNPNNNSGTHTRPSPTGCQPGCHRDAVP